MLARTVSLFRALSLFPAALVLTTATFPLPENSQREFSKLNDHILSLFMRLEKQRYLRVKSCKNIYSVK